MPRFIPEIPLKFIFVATSLVAMTCAGCGGDSQPEAVADKSEIEQFLADNPDADVDMGMEDEDSIDE